MTIKYGYPIDQWEMAKKEAGAILAERAKIRGMIAYSQLAQQIKSINIEPHSFAMGAFLGEISESEEAAGRGMLSVIVVHKAGDMQPGPGFFDLAKQLGKDTSDILRCWVDELYKVHGYWEKAK